MIYLAVRNRDRVEVIESFQALSDADAWEYIRTYHPGGVPFRHDDGDLLVSPDWATIAPVFRALVVPEAPSESTVSPEQDT